MVETTKADVATEQIKTTAKGATPATPKEPFVFKR